MRIIIYIDDLLVMAPRKEQAQEHTECLIFLLENLGFTVNRQKSLTDPTQEIDFLGLVADSVLMELELRLPGSKIKNIRSDAKALLQMVQPTAREVSRLLGKLGHATHAMRARGSTLYQTRYLSWRCLRTSRKPRSRRGQLEKGDSHALLFETIVRLTYPQKCITFTKTTAKL